MEVSTSKGAGSGIGECCPAVGDSLAGTDDTGATVLDFGGLVFAALPLTMAFADAFFIAFLAAGIFFILVFDLAFAAFVDLIGRPFFFAVLVLRLRFALATGRFFALLFFLAMISLLLAV